MQRRSKKTSCCGRHRIKLSMLTMKPYKHRERDFEAPRKAPSSQNSTKQTKATREKKIDKGLEKEGSPKVLKVPTMTLFEATWRSDVKQPDPKDQLETRLSPGRKPMLKRNVMSNEAADPKQTAIWLLYSTSNVRILFMAPPCHECDQNLSILSLVRLLWWSCRSTSGRNASAHLLNASQQTCHCREQYPSGI